MTWCRDGAVSKSVGSITICRMGIEFNEKALKKLFESVAQTVDDADRAFRATHEGFPFDVVLADASDALPLQLPASTLEAYARAVADGQPFEFILEG